MSVRINSVFFLTIFIFFYSSCSQDETSYINPGSIYLNKVDSVVLENSEPLFGKFVEQFRINDAGDIWIFSERNQERIFVYDGQGRFVNVLGERGKGPKGIVNVYGFDIDNKSQVIIYDAAQQMLKVFDLTGELIRSNAFFSDGELWAHPYRIYAYEGRLLISVTETEHIYEPHKSKLLALINYDGKIDTVFGMHDFFTKEDNSYSAENNILVDSGTIFTNSVGSPYIQIYNRNTFKKEEYVGEKTANFSIPEKEIHGNLPISEINKRVAGSSAMSGIYATKDFIVLNMQTLTEEFFENIDFSKKKNTLVVYDKKTMQFIKEISVPHTLAAGQNNKLYFIEDFNPDNYTIGIYELKNQK